MNDLAEQKRELIARSDLYREAMAADLGRIKASVAWVPRTIQVLRWASPLMVVVAPIVGLLTGKKVKAKPEAPPKRNLLSKVLAGIAMYRRVKSIVDTFRPARPVQRVSW